jgi:hypothetical protein
MILLDALGNLGDSPVGVGLLQRPLVREFIESTASTYSGEFMTLCRRLIESPHEESWRYVPLDTFGTDESSA